MTVVPPTAFPKGNGIGRREKVCVVDHDHVQPSFGELLRHDGTARARADHDGIAPLHAADIGIGRDLETRIGSEDRTGAPFTERVRA
jgi:hypothetical protein